MKLSGSLLSSLLLVIVTSSARADGVIIECPYSVELQPVVPAGWSGYPGYDKAPFALASIGSGQVLCYYGMKIPNPPYQPSLHTLALIQRSVPPGAQCVVNQTNPRQIDCLSQSAGAPKQQIIRK
jgi:hypothetical protein